MWRAAILHLFLPSISGTLTFSRLNPFTIQLFGPTDLGTLSHDFYTTVRFNDEKAFKCVQDALNMTSPVDKTNTTQGTYLLGMCWNLGSREPDVSVQWNICASDGIYTLSPNRKLLASSKREFDYEKPTETLSEKFASNSHEIQVRYICDHSPTDMVSADSTGASEIRSVTIRSLVFCTNTTRSENIELISSIPLLNIFVDEPGAPNFWEYRFRYPSSATQTHTDTTGKTRDESYILGRTSSPTTDLSEERFSDLEIDAGDPFVSRMLRYQIEDGDLCEPFNVPRSVEIIYMCPLEGLEMEKTQLPGQVQYSMSRYPGKKFFARIRQVEETRLCHYEFVIDATSLCMFKHFRHISKSMEVKNTIRCYSN